MREERSIWVAGDFDSARMGAELYAALHGSRTVPARSPGRRRLQLMGTLNLLGLLLVAYLCLLAVWPERVARPEVLRRACGPATPFGVPQGVPPDPCTIVHHCAALSPCQTEVPMSNGNNTTAAALAALASAANQRDTDAAALASLQQQVVTQTQTVAGNQAGLVAAYQAAVDALFANEGLAPPTPTPASSFAAGARHQHAALGPPLVKK